MSATAYILAACGTCGDVSIPASAFRVGSRESGQFWFQCPGCSVIVRGQFSRLDLFDECIRAGALMEDGFDPDRPVGILTVDDVLDAKLLLDVTDDVVSLLDPICGCAMCIKGWPTSSCLKR